MKLKTENLVLKSKFGSKSGQQIEPNAGSLSPPYSNPSSSPQRQVGEGQEEGCSHFPPQSLDGLAEPIDELAMTPESQQSAGESSFHNQYYDYDVL